MASNFNPISILQELYQKMNKPLPCYQMEMLPDIKFKCKVTTYEGYVEEAIEANKKQAKYVASEKMLKKLGKNLTFNNINSMSPIQTMPNCKTNYVGQLNEHASKSGVPYPVYSEDYAQGMFISVCTFGKLESKGCGSTKKEAKQQASKEMLSMVDLKGVETKKPDKKQPENTISKAEISNLIDTYSKMSLKWKDQQGNNEASPINTSFSLEKSSNTNIKDILEQRANLYEIKQIQKEPYVMLYKESNSNITVCGCGQTKDEALTDLYDTLLVILNPPIIN